MVKVAATGGCRNTTAGGEQQDRQQTEAMSQHRLCPYHKWQTPKQHRPGVSQDGATHAA